MYKNNFLSPPLRCTQVAFGWAPPPAEGEEPDGPLTGRTKVMALPPAPELAHLLAPYTDEKP